MRPDQIAAHPRLPVACRIVAETLTGMYREWPRLARIKASHRKWLMLQIAFTLSLRPQPGDPGSGLTPSRFIAMVDDLSVASRNTADSFLKELTACGFLRVIRHDHDRRMRFLMPMENTTAAMNGWLQGHMNALDALDGGKRRVDCFSEIFPRIVDRLAADALWRAGSPGIDPFLAMQLGGMVLEEILLLGLGHFSEGARDDHPVFLRSFSASRLASRYGISARSIKNVIRRAEASGTIGLVGMAGERELWVSVGFIRNYLSWQARKLACLDAAWHDAAGSEFPPEKPMKVPLAFPAF